MAFEKLLVESINRLTPHEKSEVCAKLQGEEKMNSKSLLTQMTLRMLLKEHVVEDEARYRAQILEARSFLRSVADHLVVMRPDDFCTSVAVEESISSVADAFDRLIAEEPQEAQRVIPWRAWRTSGVHVN